DTQNETASKLTKFSNLEDQNSSLIEEESKISLLVLYSKIDEYKRLCKSVKVALQARSTSYEAYNQAQLEFIRIREQYQRLSFDKQNKKLGILKKELLDA